MLGHAIFSSVVAGAIALGLAGCGKTPTDDPKADDPPAKPQAESPEKARLLLAEAAELEAANDLETALLRARAAIEAGGGREATIAAAKLAISMARHDEAIGLLQPLVDSDPGDAIAQYDLALAHHRRNDYNGARRGYLAALRADPALADARFNLALLCWQRGIQGEGKHHVEKFLEAFPSDPRGAALKAMIAGERPAASPVVPEPPAAASASAG
jgi:tetratricopeptide (TPR) repeat protein